MRVTAPRLYTNPFRVDAPCETLVSLSDPVYVGDGFYAHMEQKRCYAVKARYSGGTVLTLFYQEPCK